MTIMYRLYYIGFVILSTQGYQRDWGLDSVSIELKLLTFRVRASVSITIIRVGIRVGLRIGIWLGLGLGLGVRVRAKVRVRVKVRTGARVRDRVRFSVDITILLGWG